MNSGPSGNESWPGPADLATGAAADQNGSSYLWQADSIRPFRTFTDPHGKAVEAVAFNANGAVLAAADENKTVYFWPVGKLP